LRGADKLNKVKPAKAKITLISEKVEMAEQAEGPLAPKRETALLIKS
jgi:hypothetical protein